MNIGKQFSNGLLSMLLTHGAFLILGALPPAALAADQQEKDLLLGQQTYVQWCSACHDAGPGHPGTQRLEIDRGKESSVLLSRSDLTAEYVSTIVRVGIGMMPPFRITEIPDTEVQSVARYVVSHKTPFQAKAKVQP